MSPAAFSLHMFLQPWLLYLLVCWPGWGSWHLVWELTPGVAAVQEAAVGCWPGWESWHLVWLLCRGPPAGYCLLAWCERWVSLYMRACFAWHV
jgi:hypothetical protein